MKRILVAGVAVLSSWALVAHAGSLASLCQDSLAQNRQPDFADGGFQSLKTVQVVGTPPVLRLNTNLDVLNPQKIMLPFDQNVSISYVYQAGGAGWALGWMYADDLVRKGYLDSNGNLVDSDNDGIPDFHEDIYNLSPARYVGKFRKCGSSPPTFTWNGKTLIEPEIASDTCGATFGTTSKTAFLADGGMGSVSGWQVGKASGSTPTTPTIEFTDTGMYARIPNLLEPADPANGGLGLGHLVFLNADDDSDTTTKPLVPVADISTTVNGVPDYDVSAYDGNGRLLPAGSNPDPGVTLYDRTLNLGTLPGNREIIFYLVVFYTSQAIRLPRSHQRRLQALAEHADRRPLQPHRLQPGREPQHVQPGCSGGHRLRLLDQHHLHRGRRHLHRVARPGDADSPRLAGRRLRPHHAARGGERSALDDQPHAPRDRGRAEHGPLPLDPRLRGPERRW